MAITIPYDSELQYSICINEDAIYPPDAIDIGFQGSVICDYEVYQIPPHQLPIDNPDLFQISGYSIFLRLKSSSREITDRERIYLTSFSCYDFLINEIETNKPAFEIYKIDNSK